jgi:DNA-directed RNA polymerase sigma subunit (sigma70/sigma32)
LETALAGLPADPERDATMVHALPTPDLATLSLGDLIRVASAQPVIDERDEDELMARALGGDLEARARLVMGNLRVPIDEAIRRRGLLPQRKLMPMGVSTLLEAARTYDPARDGHFSSYVRSRVRLAMRYESPVS